MKSRHVSMYAFSNLIKCRRAVTSSCTDISYSLSLGASYETKTQEEISRYNTAFAGYQKITIEHVLLYPFVVTLNAG